jgi:hypothetical protein
MNSYCIVVLCNIGRQPDDWHFLITCEFEKSTVYHDSRYSGVYLPVRPSGTVHCTLYTHVLDSNRRRRRQVSNK